MGAYPEMVLGSGVVLMHHKPPLTWLAGGMLAVWLWSVAGCAPDTPSPVETQPRAMISFYHVAPTGSDLGSGRSGNPWRTLQHAADTLTEGEVVIVADGTYSGFHTTTSGSADYPIAFLALGDSVIINTRNDNTPDCINIEGHDGIMIDGFVIRNAPRVGVRAVNCDDVTIRNCDIQFSGLDAILTGFAVRVRILNNVCGDSAAEHGIYVSNSRGPGDDPIIRGNYCYGNGRSGIQLNGDCRSGGDGTIDNAVIEGNVVTGNRAKGISLISAINYRVVNNVIYRNVSGAAGIHCTDEPGCGLPSSGVIANNSMNETAMVCVRITDASTDNVIFNNIFVGGVADEVGGSDFGVNETGLDNYLDPTNDDYRPSGTGPGINGGVAIYSGEAAPIFDIEGQRRPWANLYDCGAYEHISTAAGI